MGLAHKFRMAGGGFIPEIVLGTQAVEAQKLAGTSFLTRAESLFGDNAASIGVNNTMSLSQ